jgi:hypothetical protein
MQLRRGDFLGCVLGLHRARFELLDSRNFPAGEEELKLAIEQAYEYILVVRFLSGAVCELYVFKERHARDGHLQGLPPAIGAV